MSRLLLISLCTTLSVAVGRLPAAEIVTLSAENWDQYAPRGKEVDCIYGDYVLRNDKITAVIARPVPGRDANMTVRDAGGAIIDLTLRGQENDQLSAFYPGAALYPLEYSTVRAVGGAVNALGGLGSGFSVSANGRQIRLTCVSGKTKDKASVSVEYQLDDGDAAILVTTAYSNPHDKPIEIDLVDRVRADKTFDYGETPEWKLAWWYDKWFGQAYGIVAEGHVIERDKQPPPDEKTKQQKARPPEIRYVKDGKSKATLKPGESYKLVRRVFPGRDLIAVKATAARLAMVKLKEFPFAVKDARTMAPVTDAEIEILRGKDRYALARTGVDGLVHCSIPEAFSKELTVNVGALGRPSVLAFPLGGGFDFRDMTVNLEPPGYVAATITDERGGPIPCKVQFIGRGETKSPDFGPDSGENAVKNLCYTHNGRFRQPISPGSYDVVVSYGPEYDAVFTKLDVARGMDAKLEAKLIRTVNTPGWVSADFHNHATPSGDNTTSQLGRVINLLCEHLEFAPCTEHQRLSSYTPHLKHLKAEHLMATCVGMELTGAVLPVNHQNAFPLILKERTQHGGGPRIDVNPEVQIERLAMWDNGSDKLLQENHPNIPQIMGDRDNDGKPDDGFHKMFGFMDVIEVHPPNAILKTPTSLAEIKDKPFAIFHWLQLLNLGYRIPGVVNTDAHYTFHGSGFLRNYIKSSTDDPAKIDVMEMVRASQRGNILMTNGPFMEVKLTAAKESKKRSGIAGEDVIAPGGKAELFVRVQCPNWFDIDRVQVFINGKADEKLNFTRRTTPKRFSTETVRFEQTIPLKLAGDAHVIVAAVGEQSKLGIVMGPAHEKDLPIAVSNPIFVDTGGDGFKPNGDLLGVPLPNARPPAKK